MRTVIHQQRYRIDPGTNSVIVILVILVAVLLYYGIALSDRWDAPSLHPLLTRGAQFRPEPV